MKLYAVVAHERTENTSEVFVFGGRSLPSDPHESNAQQGAGAPYCHSHGVLKDKFENLRHGRHSPTVLRTLFRLGKRLVHLGQQHSCR